MPVLNLRNLAELGGLGHTLLGDLGLVHTPADKLGLVHTRADDLGPVHTHPDFPEGILLGGALVGLLDHLLLWRSWREDGRGRLGAAPAQALPVPHWLLPLPISHWRWEENSWEAEVGRANKKLAGAGGGFRSCSCREEGEPDDKARLAVWDPGEKLVLVGVFI